MATKIDDIGSLFIKRRKELGLTQEQLGKRVGVSKSEISKIENGRGLTVSTIEKMSEALGVSTNVRLVPKHSVSTDIIHYIVMSMGLFARQYNLTPREACNYLSRFKGLQFSIENYEAEHQLSLQECVADMFAVCQRNGGECSDCSVPRHCEDMTNDNNFLFLTEYITTKVVEWIIQDDELSLEEALLHFHNSETIEKLYDKKTGMYIESPAYIYEIFKEEMKRGTIKGITG